MTLAGAPPTEAPEILAEASPDLREGRPTALLRTTSVIFLSGLVLVTYLFLDALTKPSPLSTASAPHLVPAAALAVLLAVGATCLGLPVALVVDAVGRRFRPGLDTAGTVLVSALLFGATLLHFTENTLYTSQGIGLKTEDGLLLRLVYGALAGAGGILAARRAVGMSSRGVRWVRGLAVIIVPLALATVAAHLVSSEPPAELQPVGTSHRYNVVILSADGIDADRLSVYGYDRRTTPFLDSAAEEFRVFENAFTNNGNTTGSITALMTGASPQETGVVYPPDSLQDGDALETLPRLLGEQGYYRSNWAVPHYADGRDQNLVDAYDVDNGDRPGDSPLSFLPLGTGPGRWFVLESAENSVGLVADVLGLRELTNPYSQVSDIVGDTISDRDRLQSVLDEIGRDEPVFINTHFMATHGPEFNLEDPFYSRGQEQDTAWERDFYDDALRQFDGYVEEVYTELDRIGELDETILVVTSDHGIRYDATIRVPLMIRFPGADAAGRVDTNVQRLDVAPTVLASLGFRRPAWMTGANLLEPDDVPADRQIVATTTATRDFSNHFGFRPQDGDLLVTYIRCGTYVTVQPSGDVVEGEVRGSTSTCRDRPAPE